MASDDLRRALEDDGGFPRLRALPPEVRDLLAELDAPPRLAAHLRAVHDVAAQIVVWTQERFPTIDIDATTVLTAAALHDIGKVIHPEELSGPGSSHEEGGYRLLRDRGVDERVAAMVRDHGSWPATAPLGLLLVCLADKVWKVATRSCVERIRALVAWAGLPAGLRARPSDVAEQYTGAGDHVLILGAECV